MTYRCALNVADACFDYEQGGEGTDIASILRAIPKKILLNGGDCIPKKKTLSSPKWSVFRLLTTRSVVVFTRMGIERSISLTYWEEIHCNGAG